MLNGLTRGDRRGCERREFLTLPGIDRLSGESHTFLLPKGRLPPKARKRLILVRKPLLFLLAGCPRLVTHPFRLMPRAPVLPSACIAVCKKRECSQGHPPPKQCISTVSTQEGRWGAACPGQAVSYSRIRSDFRCFNPHLFDPPFELPRGKEGMTRKGGLQRGQQRQTL